MVRQDSAIYGVHLETLNSSMHVKESEICDDVGYVQNCVRGAKDIRPRYEYALLLHGSKLDLGPSFYEIRLGSHRPKCNMASINGLGVGLLDSSSE